MTATITRKGKPAKGKASTKPRKPDIDQEAAGNLTNGTTSEQPEVNGIGEHATVVEPPSKPPDRNELGQFVTGHNGGPGRPPGSKNKLVEDFLADFHAAWQEHGANALKQMVEKEPSAFVRAAVQLMPKDVLVEARGAGLVVVETPAAIKALIEALPELVNGKALDLPAPAEEAVDAIPPAG